MGLRRKIVMIAVLLWFSYYISYWVRSVTEHVISASQEEKDCWMWKRPPPISKQPVEDSEDLEDGRKMRRVNQRTQNVKEKVLKGIALWSHNVCNSCSFITSAVVITITTCFTILMPIDLLLNKMRPMQSLAATYVRRFWIPQLRHHVLITSVKLAWKVPLLV